MLLLLKPLPAPQQDTSIQQSWDKSVSPPLHSPTSWWEQEVQQILDQGFCISSTQRVLVLLTWQLLERSWKQGALWPDRAVFVFLAAVSFPGQEELVMFSGRNWARGREQQVTCPAGPHRRQVTHHAFTHRQCRVELRSMLLVCGRKPENAEKAHGGNMQMSLRMAWGQEVNLQTLGSSSNHCSAATLLFFYSTWIRYANLSVRWII